MDSPFMEAITAGLVALGLAVVRFEFPYMAQRRLGGTKRPPDRLPVLLDHYRQLHAELRPQVAGPLLIGGKSMGGRVASMVADALYDARRIAGLVCLGYPFHPPGKPTQLRTKHLAGMKTPTLIVHGTRDDFGFPNEVNTYDLSKAISLHWVEDGDHDLKPRKSVAGIGAAEALRQITSEVKDWAGKL